MGKKIRAELDQQYLFPPSPEDWLNADHPARFIREIVDLLDLEELGFEHGQSESVRGRPCYSVELLLSVWLYGYSERIRSSRRLERACRDHIGLIWLTGNHTPDHNTLWRFWDRNREPLRKVFSEVVRVAAKAGALGAVVHAADGTKVQARSSTRTAHYRKRLRRLLKKVEAEIEVLEGQIEEHGAADEEGPSLGLPEELQDRSALRARIKESLDDLEEEGREHRHPDEPEAQMMSCNGRKVISYNAQIVADESGLIVAQDVTNAGSDNRQLVPLLEQVHEHLGETADVSLADGGYYSTETIGSARTRGFEILVKEPRDKSGEGREFASSKFRYDAESDVCVCPQDKELVFSRERMRKGTRVREFRCRHFRSCPVRELCSKDRYGRRVEIREDRAAVEEHRQRLAENAELLKRRAAIAEPPFAWIKQHHGFRRFTFIGLEAVKTQWAMMANAINLNKLLKLWASGQLQLAA